jgi:DNA-binding transcriptional ArsR family regulator
LDSCDLLCLDLPHAEAIRAELAVLGPLDDAARVAKALADPTRLQIAAALQAGGELCVCDMAWVVGQAQNLVSHHLRQLRGAGLAASQRRGKLVVYSLTPRGDRLVAATLESVTESAGEAAGRE